MLTFTKPLLAVIDTKNYPVNNTDGKFGLRKVYLLVVLCRYLSLPN